jgi:hypothetical protein
VAASSCGSVEQKSVQVCNENLHETLVAPSTWKSVWSGTADAGAITRDDKLALTRKNVAKMETRFAELGVADRGVLAYMKESLREDPGKLLENWDPASSRKTLRVLLEFDAENKLGVPLRSFYSCRVVLDEESGTPWVFDAGMVAAPDGQALKRLIGM